MPPNPAQVDKAIDRPQQMLLRHMPFERKPIEQHVLLDLPFPHHRLPPAVVIWQNQTDYITILQAFFNTIHPTVPVVLSPATAGLGQNEPARKCRRNVGLSGDNRRRPAMAALADPRVLGVGPLLISSPS